MTGSLAGKRALVTGAASGIGRAIAVAMAGEGARVILADRATCDDSEAEIRAAGGEAAAVPTDVSKESDVVNLSAQVKARLGGLDILVNNAGILIEKPLLETTAADFDRLMAVNLRGVFLVGREAIRLMLQQKTGGRVINVASELAYLGRANASVYCASKGGVVSMTRAWAREFAPAILVNTLAPGPTDTPMLTGGSTSPETLAREGDNPLGRVGKADEIAAAAVFLAGPGASFMTGQCLSPNGGAAMF
ncbi:MAG TPA: SDR family oxidoreductase [Aestuariivirgaceae bacterium]|nr:SDR family oxidoreductase [Aestuariivirgaceae bacterium]